MKNLLLLTLIIVTVSCSRKGAYFIEKQYYDLDDIKSLHRKIAILPINYAYNQDSKTYLGKVFNKSDSELITEQVEMGNKLQHFIYQEFSKKSNKIEILSDTETNQILAKKDIHFNDIRRTSKVELSKILDVDAVIYCDIFVGAMYVKESTPNPFGYVPITRERKIQVADFIIEIHGNVEEEIVWKAKVQLENLILYNDEQLKKFIKLDLLPVIPYNK